ncbi:putative leucine-rich repeat-containing, plant-type, leucine-rich repeat domain superfamily [Helianthus debilis subsp. tardiflorus]
MGNNTWGLGIRFIFICIFLVTITHKCVGGGNLTIPACSEQERLALIKFKQSVKDEQGMLSSWGVGNDCCRWERVGCDDATGRVVSLHLRAKFREEEDYDKVVRYYSWLNVYDPFGFIEYYYLVGDGVNSCLTELVNLKHLDLSGNNFQESRIPEFIGSFKQLRYLNLSNTGFSGKIPHQIGNLSNLKVLDLGTPQEYLLSHDMAWISGLPKLEHLDLSGVDLSRTQNLDNLLYLIPSLVKLSLSRCGLSMAHLGSRHLNSSRKLARIRHLDLSENHFEGKLPGLFLNMTSIAFLDLSKNGLGIFENLLNMIPSVSELSLSNYGLQKVNLSPTNINFSTHSSIQHLDLSQNEIKGGFPSVLANMSSLISLDLSFNKLNSSIPVMLNLNKLDISWNKFRLIEDVGIWRQCHLKEVIVSNNNLEGDMIGPSTNVTKCSQNALEILYLHGNALNGSIPESLGRFTNLRGLDLSDNEMTGPIPEALGNLRSLQRLDLSYNQLNSLVPESLGRLTNLRGIDLSNNKMVGPIPEALGNLRSLQGLYLSYNQLNSSVPESLGRLTTLTKIFLQSNRFTGTIPVSLGKLTSLRVLSVSSNLLCGTILNSIGHLVELYLLDISNNSFQGVVSENHFANLSMLKYLDANSNNKLFFNISREWMPPFQLKVARLGSCKIEGGFPQWIRSQRKLEELVLFNASIYGPLPTWLRLLPIRILDLSHNNFTGPLTNLPSVYELRYELTGALLLQNNIFKGLIPRRLCTRTNLLVLDLSRNRLFGRIPKCLWNMSLGAMLLSSNRLSGVITLPLGIKDPSLVWLQLNDNNLSGELPRDLIYFTRLVVLDFGENKISGNVPEWIGENITGLAVLRLHKNSFTGRIPHSLCKSKGLQILDLARNNLTGSIPHCFGELNGMTENQLFSSTRAFASWGAVMQILKGVALDYTNNLQFLKNMDLSDNKLVAEIPETLTTLDALLGFNLSNNHFSGGIPRNIGNMKSLNSLDLSANELTGTIPSSLGALNFLSYLNLSHNNLSGQIPRGNQLQTLIDPFIYADNPYLCGAPLPKECSPDKKPPTTTSKNKGGHANKPKKAWFYLDIISGFATGFWGIIGVLMLKKQWRHKLFKFCEEIVDKIYVAVAVRILKMKRGREAT